MIKTNWIANLGDATMMVVVFYDPANKRLPYLCVTPQSNNDVIDAEMQELTRQYRKLGVIRYEYPHAHSIGQPFSVSHLVSTCFPYYDEPNFPDSAILNVEGAKQAAELMQRLDEQIIRDWNDRVTSGNCRLSMLPKGLVN